MVQSLLLERVQAEEDAACQNAKWKNFCAAAALGEEYCPSFDLIDISTTSTRQRWLVHLRTGKFEGSESRIRMAFICT